MTILKTSVFKIWLVNAAVVLDVHGIVLGSHAEISNMGRSTTAADPALTPIQDQDLFAAISLPVVAVSEINLEIAASSSLDNDTVCTQSRLFELVTPLFHRHQLYLSVPMIT
jgi:hypothetical protein